MSPWCDVANQKTDLNTTDQSEARISPGCHDSVISDTVRSVTWRLQGPRLDTLSQ